LSFWYFQYFRSGFCSRFAQALFKRSFDIPSFNRVFRKRNLMISSHFPTSLRTIASTTLGTVLLLSNPTGAFARDPVKSPFASNSIWNMPIGSGAVYVPANLPIVPGANTWAPLPEIEEEKIVMRPMAPSTPVYYSSAGWSGASRCSGTGNVLTSVPVPTDFVVPTDNKNSTAAFLRADGRTVVQTEPFARCGAGGSATSYMVAPTVDLYGDGIRGAHGGSGLSTLGGTLRIGELRPGGDAPRHALKVAVFARQVLASCSTRSACYRWPATNADTYAVGFYGNYNGGGNSAMRMGALLAIPASKNIDGMGLETEPGKKLAWTLQNYGAYIVDDTYAPSFGIAAENGPDGSWRNQFKSDWNVDFEQRANATTAWSRDMRRLVQALAVVDNNAPDRIGGGGTPRQPLAPPL
jgi:hypothetical protein